MKPEKIRIVKKNDEYSLEYQIGDILEVESTWYGGVNVKGKSGVPLNMDRDEYEPVTEEAEKKKTEDGIDAYSFELGIMAACCELVACGERRIAASHSFATPAQRDRWLADAQKLCEKWGVYLCREDAPVRDMLFAAGGKNGAETAGCCFLFYDREETLKEYLNSGI